MKSCSKCSAQRLILINGLCDECYYSLESGVSHHDDLYVSPKIDVDMQSWLVDRYMTTPRYNINKMDWRV